MASKPRTEIERVKATLPADEIWLALVFGSFARGAAQRNSDLDLFVEGEPEAVEAWRSALETLLNRRVSTYAPAHVKRQPLLMHEILATHILLRDSKGRLAQIAAEHADDPKLIQFQTRALREALSDFTTELPDEPLPADRWRFVSALGSLQSEVRKLVAEDRPATERYWSAERATRAIRNLLRDWPGHGNPKDVRAAAGSLESFLSPPTAQVLQRLPYDDASDSPADPRPDAQWVETQAQLAPHIQEVVSAAEAALRRSLAADKGTSVP